MTEHGYCHIATRLHGADLVIAVRQGAMRETSMCYAIRDEIIAAIDATQASNVVLDLKSVEFIGSVGLLAFLAAKRRLPKGRIVLCEMSSNIRELFRACALIGSDSTTPGPFEVAGSVPSALAELSSAIDD